MLREVGWLVRGGVWPCHIVWVQRSVTGSLSFREVQMRRRRKKVTYENIEGERNDCLIIIKNIGC